MEARTDFIGLWDKCLLRSVEQLAFYSDGHIIFSFENPLAYPLRFAFQFKWLSAIVSLPYFLKFVMY